MESNFQKIFAMIRALIAESSATASNSPPLVVLSEENPQKPVLNKNTQRTGTSIELMTMSRNQVIRKMTVHR